MTKMLSAFASLLLLLFASGCCRPEIIGSVPNTLRPQETNNWCWAATTQMLAQHVGLSVTQCALANHRFGKTNCCTEQTAGTPCPKTNDCNSPGWLELDFAGAKSDTTDIAMSWAAMRRQIYCSRKPMAYAYGTPGVVGHVVVIKGYVTVGSTNYLVLNDPWSPCMGQERLLAYDEYADPPGDSTHWTTWYNLAKK